MMICGLGRCNPALGRSCTVQDDRNLGTILLYDNRELESFSRLRYIKVML